MSPHSIRQTRKKLGLTQLAFARKLGVSYATVNRWEQGRAKPQPDRIQRLGGLVAALRNGRAHDEDSAFAQRNNTSSRRHRFSTAVALDEAAIVVLAREIARLMAALDGMQPKIEVRMRISRRVGGDCSAANAILQTVNRKWLL